MKIVTKMAVFCIPLLFIGALVTPHINSHSFNNNKQESTIPTKSVDNLIEVQLDYYCENGTIYSYVKKISTREAIQLTETLQKLDISIEKVFHELNAPPEQKYSTLTDNLKNFLIGTKAVSDTKNLWITNDDPDEDNPLINMACAVTLMLFPGSSIFAGFHGWGRVLGIDILGFFTASGGRISTVSLLPNYYGNQNLTIGELEFWGGCMLGFTGMTLKLINWVPFITWPLIYAQGTTAFIYFVKLN